MALYSVCGHRAPWVPWAHGPHGPMGPWALKGGPYNRSGTIIYVIAPEQLYTYIITNSQNFSQPLTTSHNVSQPPNFVSRWLLGSRAARNRKNKSQIQQMRINQLLLNS